MSDKEVRTIGTNRFINRVLEKKKDRVKRIERLDYPVYCLPVEVTERTSEPYEEIEKNMEKILLLTEVDSRDALLKTMGLEAFKNVGYNTIDYLMSINHIDEKNQKLFITQLGKESIYKNEKIKLEKSARLIYFDALSMSPLPSKLYNRNESMFISPEDQEEFWKLNVIDIWEDFPLSKMQELMEISGEERMEYNIPQEAIDIRLEDKILKYSREQILSKGIIMFFPLIIVLYDNVNEINSNTLKVYNGVSGSEESFFSNLIKINYGRIYPVIAPLLESFNVIKDMEAYVWGEKVEDTSLIKASNITLDQDGNAVYKVDEFDAKKWISEDNFKVIKDAFYKNIVCFSDRNHHGRLMKLIVSSKACDMFKGYMIERLKDKLKKQDKSDEYIKRQIEKMLEKSK